MKRAAGILLYSKQLNKYLLGHPTEIYGKPNAWTIPKGELHPSENVMDGAVRETAEETGLDIYAFPGLQFAPDEGWAADYTGELRPHFEFTVGRHKIVEVYKVIDPSGYLTDFNFECQSLIDKTDKPEIDKWEWFTREEARRIIHKSQIELFD